MAGSDAPQSVSQEHAKGPSYLGEAVNLLSASFLDDKDAQTKAQVEQYGTQFLKTAGLFMRGRIGVAATVATYAFGEMRRGDDLGTQVLDGGLGSLKGVGTRAIFTKMPAGADVATKGVMMGGGSRLLDAGLTRSNYLDADGAFNLAGGIDKASSIAFNKQALAADVLTFGLAHGGMVGLNKLTNNAVQRSGLLSTMFTGTTFGASTGAYLEIQRQSFAGEQLDIGKIARSAAIQGGLDTLAAVPGGMQARRASFVRQSQPTEVNEQRRIHDAVELRPDFSLNSLVRDSVSNAKPNLSFFDAPAVVRERVTEVARSVTPAERQRSLSELLQIAKQPYESGNEARVSAAYDAAAAIGKVDPALYRKEFFEPIVAEMGNREQHYGWRVFAATRLAGLERSGQLPTELKASDIPDLRMKAVELAPEQQTALREKTESALHDAKALAKMLGSNGELGQLFPEIFGHYNKSGGIMGKPQHGGHDYTVGGHTVRVLDNVRKHPMFAQLSPKDQTNLLFASLMHDVGKRAYVSDPGHEAMSYNAAWGVLQTMGYPPQRIHRITDLMYRHIDTSYHSKSLHSKRMADPFQLDDTAVLFRHDPAVLQLRIMNEGDLKAVRKNSALWNEDAKVELDKSADLTAHGAQRLKENLVPVLTAELPQRFGLYDLPAGASVMAHTSPHLRDGNFFRQLPLIESPHFSGSASLVNRQHLRLYDQKADMVALFSAPPEHISQAHRTGLWTGEQLGWNGHVNLTREWSKSPLAAQFATEANTKLAELGFGRDGFGQNPALTEYRSRLARYDTVNEMLAAEGPNSQLARAHQAVTEAYTRYEDGRPTETFNEFKVNNPAVSGIGVVSRGREIIFENKTQATTGDALVIPEAIWTEAQKRNLPFIVLDRP